MYDWGKYFYGGIEKAVFIATVVGFLTYALLLCIFKT